MNVSKNAASLCMRLYYDDKKYLLDYTSIDKEKKDLRILKQFCNKNAIKYTEILISSRFCFNQCVLSISINNQFELLSIIQKLKKKYINLHISIGGNYRLNEIIKHINCLKRIKTKAAAKNLYLQQKQFYIAYVYIFNIIKKIKKMGIKVIGDDHKKR